MNETKQPAKGGALPLQGRHYSRPLCREETPSDFIPLKLVVQPGGPVVELTRPDMLMGRHSEVDVRLPSADVSRRHCRFLFADHTWQIIDLDSLNGVFVNGDRVQHATLRDRDIVTIGCFRFEVALCGSAAAAGDSQNFDEVIHRIAEALPRAAPGIDAQRRAS